MVSVKSLLERSACGGDRRSRIAESAEAPLTAGKFADRALQIVDAEFGPHPVGEPELGVGALPQKKVRQPLFPAGPDQQVDLRRAVVVLARLGDEAAEGAE